VTSAIIKGTEEVLFFAVMNLIMQYNNLIGSTDPMVAQNVLGA